MATPNPTGHTGLRFLLRPPWRTVVPGVVLLAGFFLAYGLWKPGLVVTDGRHNRGENGLWLQHGWLGDDRWFRENARDTTKFRTAARLGELRTILTMNGIRYVYPHLCPAVPDGRLPAVDPAQTERLLDALGPEVRVLPWIGAAGVNLRWERWRQNFCASAAELLRKHPRLAGVHVNLEPMRSGDREYLQLLRELRQALPPGKILSTAAYPPPTRWHPYLDVHWQEAYYREVTPLADQVVVMMYDTALKQPKLYQKLMADWTAEVLAWAGSTPVLLGVPAYDDAGVGYHEPGVENLENALAGIHAGLARVPAPPANYRGIAIYSEWEMDAKEWELWRRQFLKP